MEIRIIDYKVQAGYAELAAEHGSVFNQVAWLNLFEESIQVCALFNKDNKIQGAFNLYRRGKFLRFIVSPPYAGNCALFFLNSSQNAANRNGAIRDVMKAIEHFLDPGFLEVVRLVFPPKHIDFLPFYWEGYKVIPEYTYQLNLLDSSEPELLSRFSPERRNDIKKAVKDGIEVKQTFDYQLVKNLVHKSFERQNSKSEEVYLNKILDSFANDQNSFAFVSYKDGKPSAAAFCVHYRGTCYYILGGYDSNNRHQGAGALALWSCIQHALKIGIELFDFEGSTIKDIEKYFRGFGGDLIPCFSVNKAALPLEIIMKPFRRKLF